MEKTDLSAFFLSETGAVEIDLPNRDADPMMIDGQRVIVHVYGPATARYQKAQDELDKQAAMRAAALFKFQGAKNKKDELDKEANARFLAAITERIEGINGDPFDTYCDLRVKFIADQVRTYIGDQANFFKGSATT